MFGRYSDVEHPVNPFLSCLSLPKNVNDYCSYPNSRAILRFHAKSGEAVENTNGAKEPQCNSLEIGKKDTKQSKSDPKLASLAAWLEQNKWGNQGRSMRFGSSEAIIIGLSYNFVV